MTLTELYEKRGKLFADAQALLDQINDDTDATTRKDLEDRAEKLMDEADELTKRIKLEERSAKAQQAEEERRSRERPLGGNGTTRGVDNPGGDPQAEAEQRSAEYRSAFAKYICGAELSAEERTVLRRAETRAQTVGTPADGGYTVPTTLMAEIVKSMADWGPMFDTDVARVFTTPSGNPMTLPTVNDTASTAEAHTEGGTVTNDGGKDVTFGAKTLGAYAFDTEWVQWSWELDEDSIFAMEQLLGQLLGERLARKGNNQLTVGTGSAPNGIVSASSLGKSAASATAIAPDELVDLFHSVNAAYRRSPKCRWQFADTTLAAIRKMKDGQGNYLWQMGDVRVGAPDTLLGKPYSVNDDVPAIATGNKSVIFGDHSKYFVRKVGAVRTIVARERFAPDLGILGVMRLDGELADTAAVKHLIQA